MKILVDKTGGLMLNINGLHNFYYLPEPRDMRCKVLNYLKNFWNQIYAYRNDKKYLKGQKER